MHELPLLTDVGRKILQCCVYNLYDMRKFDSELRPHMIYTYFEKNPSKSVTKVEIDDCLLYFEEAGLIRNVERNGIGQIHDFRLSHQGFYYFDLEKALKREQRKEILCNSFLLPVIVAIITTLITLLLSV